MPRVINIRSHLLYSARSCTLAVHTKNIKFNYPQQGFRQSVYVAETCPMIAKQELVSRCMVQRVPYRRETRWSQQLSYRITPDARYMPPRRGLCHWIAPPYSLFHLRSTLYRADPRYAQSITRQIAYRATSNIDTIHSAFIQQRS